MNDGADETWTAHLVTTEQIVRVARNVSRELREHVVMVRSELERQKEHDDGR